MHCINDMINSMSNMSPAPRSYTMQFINATEYNEDRRRDRLAMSLSPRPDRKVTTDHPKPCHYGRACTFRGHGGHCVFHHPTGRMIDTVCPFASTPSGCTRTGCKFHHPSNATSLTTVSSQDSSVSASRTKITMATSAAPRTKRLKLVAAWVQDCSGSMKGSREREAARGLALLHDEVLEPEDWLSVVCFDSKVEVLHELMQKKRLNMKLDQRNVLKAGGGSTAIYDALSACITGLRAKLKDRNFRQVNRNAFYQLVLVTDGGDNMSSTTLTEAAALVANPRIPNFHLVVVGIGMPRGTSDTLSRILCAATHAQYMEVDDIARLGETMQRIVTDVRARLVVEIEVQTLRVVGGSAADVRRLTAGMASNQITAGNAGRGSGRKRGKGGMRAHRIV